MRVLLKALVPALALPLLLCGCSNSVSQNELDRASEAVRTGLTAWQKGEKAAALKTRPEPVEFSDDEWAGGKVKLVSFDLKKTEGKPGEPIRCIVLLTIKDGQGKTIEKDAVYQVRNGTPTVVARDPYF